jgi:hypothetical protein
MLCLRCRLLMPLYAFAAWYLCVVSWWRLGGTAAYVVRAVKNCRRDNLHPLPTCPVLHRLCPWLCVGLVWLSCLQFCMRCVWFNYCKANPAYLQLTNLRDLRSMATYRHVQDIVHINTRPIGAADAYSSQGLRGES